MHSARRGLFAAIAVAGIAGLLLAAATDDRSLAFTLGVQPTQVAAVLKPAQTACQGPVYVSSDAALAELKAGTFRRQGPPLALSTRSAPGGSVLGTGAVPGGYADNSIVRAPVGGLRDGSTVFVCVTNRGRTKVALYGGAPQAARTSAAFVDGKHVDTDLTLVFARSERSMLEALPDVFRRAALWHPAWAGAWLYWALGALALFGVPLLLARAIAQADEGDVAS